MRWKLGFLYTQLHLPFSIDIVPLRGIDENMRVAFSIDIKALTGYCEKGTEGTTGTIGTRYTMFFSF
jgi:hypothetical protein